MRNFILKVISDWDPMGLANIAPKDEYLSEDTLNNITDYVKEEFFNEEMIPPYDKKDIIEILNYYASQSVIPEFYTFDEIDRKKFKRINPRLALLVIFLCAVLLIFASYAWFSMNLNIKIK